VNKLTPRIIVILCFLLLTVFLYQAGQPWWCAKADLIPWSWDTYGPHNSQHLIDPYSFSHILHGFLFVWICIALRLSPIWYFAFGAIIETLWEIAENSMFVIERYRAATIAYDYAGDSILNSLSDLGCCLLGMFICIQIGVRRSIVLFCLIEGIMALTIRDGFLLNILMLVYPIDAVRTWQAP